MITGKAVDTKGNPVIADILISCGDIAFSAKSDANGIFEVTYSDGCDDDLIVTAAVDSEKFYTPFYYNNLPPEYYKKKLFKSVGYLKSEEQEKVDIGKITVRVYFGKVKILIDKKDAGKIFDFAAGNRLRIRDKSGNLIYENPINKGLNEQESSINIALPYGTYGLEIKNPNFDWQPLTGAITISNDLPVTVKFALRKFSALESPKFKAIFKLDKTAALKELKNRGFAFTTGEFEERLTKGNIEAVILYLKAGMSPNTRFTHGFTPLMQAVDHPDIVELLIKTGANVNLQTDKYTLPEGEEGEPLSEITPLMIAVYQQNVETLRTMLENGALPNITNTFGNSALSIAVENGRESIVEELLKFGANPNAKDRSGKFLIDVAKERSDWEIVKLLEKSLENQK